MKLSLAPGTKTEFAYRVPAEKTVPHLFPDAHEFQMMPTVFATGFMVGLMEWTCMKVIENHLDSGEGSLGVHINVSHLAAATAYDAAAALAPVRGYSTPYRAAHLWWPGRPAGGHPEHHELLPVSRTPG